MLESGRFTAAVGFVLQGQDAVVIDKTVTATEAVQKGNGRVEFVLSWTDAAR